MRRGFEAWPKAALLLAILVVADGLRGPALAAQAGRPTPSAPPAPSALAARLPQDFRQASRQVQGSALVPEAAPQAQLLERPDGARLLAYELRRANGAADWLFVVPGELIITLATDAQVAAVRAHAAAPGARFSIADEVPGTRIMMVRATAAAPMSPEEVRALFVRTFGIEPLVAEPNQLLRDEGAQDRQYQREAQPWAHANFGAGAGNGKVDADIDGIEALSRLAYATPSGPVVRRPTIMVIDSGVDVTHPALRDSIWTNPGETPGNNIDDDNNGYRDDVNGWNFADSNNLLFDTNGHGTHVAGIIVGRPDPIRPAIRGAAIGSTIVVARIDVERNGALMQVIRALHYAVEKRLSLINLSITFVVTSPTLDQALADFEAVEGISVAAAGNARPGEAPVNLLENPRYPCMSPYVVCVAASDSGDRLATFSNFGARMSQLGRAGVALAAPGTDIMSTLPGGMYGFKSGTSMATPIVTSAFAAAWRVRPTASRNEIRFQVINTSDRVRELDISQVEEGRRLNLYNALFGRPDHDYQLGYCDERVTDPQTGQSWLRYQQSPFANSGEPGIDGASLAGAFTICTTAQLANIQGDMLDRVFVLKRNIRWREDTSGSSSTAIGDRDGRVLPFNGILDGGGYAIVGFDQGVRANAGLIARLGPRGHVLNMRFREARVRGTNVAAVVAARNDGGRLFNVQASGSVEAPTAGGLVVGMYGGEIRYSAFDGSVSGNARVGGLAAQVVGQTATIADSVFTGTVTAPFEVGGLVGYMDGALLTRSHASFYMPTASSPTRTIAGGLVGHMLCRARIENSFAEGSLSATAMAGGLVGRMTNADIVRAYASVFISTDNATTGGAIGEIQDGIATGGGNYRCSESNIKPPRSTHSEAYFDSFLGQTGLGIGRTAAQLRDPATFVTWNDGVWGKAAGYMPALNRLPRSTHPDY